MPWLNPPLFLFYSRKDVSDHEVHVRQLRQHVPGEVLGPLFPVTHGTCSQDSCLETMLVCLWVVTLTRILLELTQRGPGMLTVLPGAGQPGTLSKKK